MYKFKSFEHSKAYCLKVAKDKYKTNLTESSLNKMETVYNKIIEWEKLEYVSLEEVDILKQLAYMVFTCNKNEFTTVMSGMSYQIKRMEEGKLFLKDCVQNINISLDLKRYNKIKLLIEYTDEEKVFLENKKLELKNKKDNFVSYIKNTIDIYEENPNKFKYGLKGVYLIYDEHGELAYVGRSVDCVFNRCEQSINQRGLTNSYSKIEILIFKNKSDVVIYEAYLIGLLKPYKNSDMNYSDSPSITLPEIWEKHIFDKKEVDFSFLSRLYYGAEKNAELVLEEYL